MGWSFLDLFRKKEKQEEPPEAVEVVSEEDEEELVTNEELLRIFERETLYLGTPEWEIISAQTKITVLEEMRTNEWEKVRYLCFKSKTFFGFDDSNDGCYLSHDGSWLIIYQHEPVDLNPILSKCGKHLRLLRYDGELTAPLELSSMKQLRYLHIGESVLPYDWHNSISGLEHLEALETLRLYGPNFSVLDARRLKHLKVLSINHNRGLNAVIGLTALHNLKDIIFWGIPEIQELDFAGLQNLEHLRLGDMPNLIILPSLTQFSQLKTLELYRIRRIRSIDLTGLKMLESARLNENRFLNQIHGLETLDNLNRFDIAYAAIRRVPDALRGKPLTDLNLLGLELEELPDWLPELGLPFTRDKFGDGIILHETTVGDMDMSIFDQSQEMILQWFASRKTSDEVQLNEIKVVFLGDGESGKSHTIARLLNDGGAPLDYTDQATPGIVIKDKTYPMDGRNIRVHYWDFGGQEILHSMHRIFLTERTLYVVLVNARDETQDARARYWLHNIRSFAKDAPVILVLNKIDQNPKAKVNEPELRSRYGNLRQVVSMSALEFSQEEFNREFTDVLLREIRQTGYPDVKWPIPWTKVKGELENMTTNYIRGDRYKEICRQCSVDRTEKDLLHWFNDLGVSYCCCDDYRLEDYMILRPDWITNALYIILFNHCPGAKNGLIPHRSIYGLLKKDPDDAAQIRRVLPNAFYTWEEIRYVLEVFHKSQLSFDAGDSCEFIPMLCDPASSPVALEYERGEQTLEFRMEFDYLPNNLLHQLMVDRRVELQMEHVWRTGALFAQAETGFSAVVTMDESTLKILVQHSDGMHRPNTYLSMLKANVDRIWQKMGLKEPKNWLIYKFQGKQSKFSYERLLKMHARGNKEEYCEALDRDFLIEDILNQAAPDTAGDQRALLDAIIQACQSLQGNRKCWDWDENTRNTAVRDLLRAKGYSVNDQTLQGRSGTGVSTGELDLDIRIMPQTPWAICEALIVEGYSKKWNEHLDKLLNNYNPYSLPALYLLTYVDCAQEKFGEIWSKYQKHIREDVPSGFTLVPGSVQTDLFRDHDATRAARCCYRKGSYTPTVYHIFARIGG